MLLPLTFVMLKHCIHMWSLIMMLPYYFSYNMMLVLCGYNSVRIVLSFKIIECNNYII
jgi:hypothetical protein